MAGESPDTQIIAVLLVANSCLQQQVASLEEQCRELEEKLGKNSTNSSKPPSSDGYQKPNADNPKSTETPDPKSLRESSGLKAGGQKNHKGHCLLATDNPDSTEHHTVTHCQACNKALHDTEAVSHIERQVFEPDKPGSFSVTAHIVEIKICSCGHRNRANFPEGVNSPVQYGPVTRAMSIHLCQYLMVPYDRASEFFRDMFSMSISTGTLCRFQKVAWEQLESTEEGIKAALLTSVVAGADETGMRVDGKLWWLHIFRDDKSSGRRGCNLICVNACR